MKHIDIDDDPTEDILCHLEETSEWIGNALKSGADEGEQIGVLVHCTQGMSRSGAIIIGYRKLETNVHI
jgi:dual specificity phosphatase 12